MAASWLALFTMLVGVVAAAGEKLENIGSIRLGAAETLPRLEIRDFAFDGRGRCGVVQQKAGSTVMELVLIDPADAKPLENAVRVELPAKSDQRRAVPAAGWIGGDRWVVVQGSQRANDATLAWVVDIANGTTEEIKKFDDEQRCTARAVASGNGQGFAVIESWQSDGVVRYDAKGMKLWSLRPINGLRDAAMCENGDLGVLARSGHEIVVYSAAGKKLRTFTVDGAIGRKSNDVAALSVDDSGGWIVSEHSMTPAVWRLSADGKVRGSLSPKYADGQTIALRRGVSRAPDGRWWCSDGSALLRLSNDGVVDLAVGQTRLAEADELHDICAVTVDGNDRIYVVDRQTGSVHVFDGTGQPRTTLKGNLKGLGRGPEMGSVAVAGDGSVFCRPNSLGIGQSQYLKFDSDGKQLGLQPSRGGEVVDEWYYRPRGMESVVLGFERALLFNAAGQKVKTIERRADGLPLAHPDHASVAPDGSFAILAGPGIALDPEHTKVVPSITVYAPDGEAKKTIEVPEAGILAKVAVSNDRVAVTGDQCVVMIDRATWASKTYAMPQQARSGTRVPFFAAGGRELSLVETERKTVEKYRVR